jgi:predicted membrane protein
LSVLLLLLPLYCLSFFSFCHCIVCPSPFVIVLSVLLLLLSLYCLSFFSFCHCIVCPSSSFVILFSVLLLLSLFCMSFFSFCHCLVLQYNDKRRRRTDNTMTKREEGQTIQ